MTELPSLLDQVRASTGNLELNDFFDGPEVQNGPASPSGSHRRGLEDIDLGVKVSFTTRQWRERENQYHQKAIRGMQSPVKKDIKDHQAELDRNKQILSYGSSNKAKALHSKLKKIKLENKELAKRLVRVQETVTEITATNQPGEKRHVKAMTERMKYMRTARTAAQTKLDMENHLILKRIVHARPSVQPRKMMEADYKRHKRIKRNMCKLTVPPHEIQQYFNNHFEKGSPSSPGSQVQSFSHLPTMDQSPELNGSTSLPALPHIDLPENSQRPISKSKKERLFLPPTVGASKVGALRKKQVKQKKAKKGTTETGSKGKRSGCAESNVHVESSEDRGQICHEWVEIRHFVPGGEPTLRRALLIGFKKPNEKDKLIFEVSVDNLTRYTQVTYAQVKAAIDSASEEPHKKRFTLAQLAAKKLSLFGQEEAGSDDIVLLWNN